MLLKKNMGSLEKNRIITGKEYQWDKVILLYLSKRCIVLSPEKTI